ncbi:hypothetical protein Hdeb2414_s0061g00763261 [Helianthus debilis subsp. tardiflorus]
MLGLGDADGNKRNYSANFRYQMIPFWLHLFVMETTMKVLIHKSAGIGAKPSLNVECLVMDQYTKVLE